MYTHHKFDHEYDGSVETVSSYMVCAVPRSGSSLLCELLCLTGLAGAPTEFFDPESMKQFARTWGVETFDAYLEALLSRKTTPNGFFGFKAHYPQVEEAFGDRDPSRTFPNLRFVYITRRDRLRQAISWARALQTGLWAADHPPRDREPVFKREQIGRLLEQIAQHEEAWESFFARQSARPLRVTYEQLEEAPQGTVRAVMGFLEIEYPDDVALSAPTLSKQADELSEEWVRRYRSPVPASR
jgi:LPS sulfotransferase NodH